MDDSVILTRLVTERCIYGVDRNPSAVALARSTMSVRAWAVGVPFHRLVDHLRIGDSLCGTRLEDVKALGVDGLAAFESFARTVGGAEAETAPGSPLVEAARATSYEVLCDLIAGREVAGEKEAGVVRALGERVVAALRGGAPLTEEDAASLLARSTELRHRYHFVHWDLAFPEVFSRARPGFDVIIGSPPATSAAPSMPSGAADSFAADVSRPFTELARELLRQPDGRIAFVLTPRTGGG
jgi:hypothetical protein